MQKSVAQKRKSIMDMKDRAITGFIADLGSILDAVFDKNKKDVDVIAIMDKFNVVRRENPSGLVEMAGPYVWKYKDQIRTENTSFFLNNNFEEDIEDAQSKAQVAEITDFEDIPVLLNKAKRTWHCFQPTEQQIIIKKMQSIIKQYATCLSADRELSKDMYK